MEKLAVDAGGRITIPAGVLAGLGLKPGDELTLVEVAEGWLLYRSAVDPATASWWGGLSDDERRRAQSEAQRYESLGEEERERMRGK